MTHQFNDKGTCSICGCSKAFVDKNKIKCEAPKEDIVRLKPELDYGDIAHFVSKISELAPDVTDETIKKSIYTQQVYSYHPAEYDWFISEYRRNRVKWQKIHDNIKSATMPIDYESKIWKEKTAILIKRNPIDGSYAIISIG
jgi:hypothetical protein